MIKETPLSEIERREMRFRWRYDRATLALGVQPAARAVFWALFLENGAGWSGAGLVRHTGRSRSAVYQVLKRNASAGYIDHLDGRYFISDLGADALVRIHRETRKIALGHQVGFTPDVIRLFRGLGDVKVRQEASTIRFKK